MCGLQAFVCARNNAQPWLSSGLRIRMVNADGSRGQGAGGRTLLYVQLYAFVCRCGSSWNRAARGGRAMRFRVLDGLSVSPATRLSEY